MIDRKATISASFLLFPGFLALLVASGLARGAEPAKDDPKPAWRSGPVRFILSPDEDKQYKGLKTDEERAKWIEAFWARRDPSPDTPANEYRDDFYRRVEEAGTLFREGTTPPLTTDRARLLLAAGYPDSREPGADEERWVYNRAFPVSGGKPGAEKEFKVTFTKNEETGEFRMSSEGRELLNEMGQLEPAQAVALSLPAKVLAAAKAAPSAAPPAAPAAKPPAGGAAATDSVPTISATAPPVPPQVERVRLATLAAEPVADLPLVVAPRYFKAEDGSTRTVVMIALRKSDLTAGPDGKPATVLYARFTPAEAPDAFVEFLDPGLFTSYDEPSEGYVKYAVAWALKRRNYELRVGVSDGPEGKIGTARQTLALPDFKADTLMLSSITLAKAAVPGGLEPIEEDNFRVGSLRLIPWVKPAITPSDALDFKYEVYNAKPDPQTNKPMMDVTYIFEKKEGTGWRRRGSKLEPNQQEEVLGYTIPPDVIAMPGWTAGDYRLTVQVKDKVANTEVSASSEFSIVK